MSVFEPNPSHPPVGSHGRFSERLLEEDAQARERALAPQSFIVEAPAGAGKTELLSQRYLMLLGRVAEPEEIVAITFTNKAAAEMRNRILGNLQLAAAGEPPAEPHRQRTFALATAVLARSAELGWSLLAQPGRLRILTIDALCGSLARQMPLLSSFGSQPEVTDDAEPLYLEAAERTLALLESGLPGIADAVAGALAYLDNDTARLTRLLAQMLATRDQWLHNAHADELVAESAAVLKQLVAGDITEIAGAFERAGGRTLAPLVAQAADQVDDASPLARLRGWDGTLPTDQDGLPFWCALCDFLLTTQGEWRKALNKNQGFPAGAAGKASKEAMLEALAGLRAHDGLDARLARLRKLPMAEAHEDEAAIVMTLGGVLRLASAHLWQIFQARRQTDFIEVSQRALQALADADGPTELALRLDYRLQHLLVDEFQDTSPVQIRLLERLTAGWSEGDGRTLFCVGDPMQSIYRFRKADVGLFLQAGQAGIGGIALESLRLTRNNRSCPEVVDWVNAACAGLFPTQDNVAGGAIRYRPFVATRASLPGAGVGVHPLCIPADCDAAEADRLEALRVLEIIESVRKDDPTREIAVLVRARTHLSALVAEIRASRPGVRFQAVEIEALAGRQWIDDLMTLTRALCHRADRIAWLALLRGPCCGLRLDDLYRLAGAAWPDAASETMLDAGRDSVSNGVADSAGDGRADGVSNGGADHRPVDGSEARMDHGMGVESSPEPRTIVSLINDARRVSGLSEEGQRRLAHLREVMNDALAQQGRQPLARWVEGVWLQLDGPALLPDAAAAQDVEAWFRLVERLDAAGRFSPEQLQVEVGKLYAAPDPSAPDTLRFMTLHKSKGLEFDTVILPGLHRTVGQTDTPLLRWEEVPRSDGGTGLVVAPLTARSEKGAAPTAYQYLQGLEAERSGNEDLRVLYVGVTRAVRALHLVAVSRLHAETGQPLAPGGTPLATMWPVLETAFASAPAVVPAHAPKPDDLPAFNDFVPPLLRLRVPGPSVLLEEAADPTPGGARPGEGGHAPVPPSTRAGSISESDETRADLSGHDLIGTSPGDSPEAVIGTLVHRYLELIAGEGVTAWRAGRIDALRPAMRRWLGLQGLGQSEVESGADEVATMLCRCIDSPTGRWILARRERAASELALGTRSALGAAVHVIDRTFVEDGVRWIIDFKSAAVPNPTSETVLRQHAERYRLQLARYAALFAGQPEPVRCAVYYTRHDKLVELAADGLARA